jgi:3-methylfumaryl-CoA hydratase
MGQTDRNMTQTAPEIQLHDQIDPARLEALNTVLGVGGGRAHPFAHQVFFWDAQPADDLGRDGHPRVGGLIPDLGLPRRMWAGGRLEFHVALVPGVAAQKVSVLERAERKTGRSGPLGVVSLRHEIRQGGALIVTDWQDLIYREEASGPHVSDSAAAPQDEVLCETRAFTTTELFRYSALTFNGHRIHYDRDYAREVEGYPGLVVHGPLLAQYLMLMAERELGGLAAFSFRAQAPVFDFEQVSLCAKPSADGLEMWVRGPDGRLCMSASAQ